jgi:Holliday junction resolvasome RuvABC DNA-binding subunit
VEVKLLSTVPGISTASATYVLSTMSLSRLLSYGKEMSIEIIGKNSRRIGDKLAEKIITYFTYKHTI